MENIEIANLRSKIKDELTNIAGIVVTKYDQTVYEDYFNGYNHNDRVHVASVVKSIISILIGIAVDRGQIKSIEQKVLYYFPDYVVKRGAKTIKLKDEVFTRVIGHDGKAAMPWVASTTLKDSMIKANEKRSVKYDFKLEKGDKVDLVLGWFLVDPKAAKRLGLEDEKIATEFHLFKEEHFSF